MFARKSQGHIQSPWSFRSELFRSSLDLWCLQRHNFTWAFFWGRSFSCYVDESLCPSPSICSIRLNSSNLNHSESYKSAKQKAWNIFILSWACTSGRGVTMWNTAATSELHWSLPWSLVPIPRRSSDRCRRLQGVSLKNVTKTCEKRWSTIHIVYCIYGVNKKRWSTMVTICFLFCSVVFVPASNWDLFLVGKRKN